MKMPYLNLVNQLLVAISQANLDDVLCAANEIANIAIDKIPVNDEESELADALAEELDYDLDDDEYEERGIGL